jgi:hypothetical protein
VSLKIRYFVVDLFSSIWLVTFYIPFPVHVSYSIFSRCLLLFLWKCIDILKILLKSNKCNIFTIFGDTGFSTQGFMFARQAHCQNFFNFLKGSSWTRLEWWSSRSVSWVAGIIGINHCKRHFMVLETDFLYLT